MKNGWVVIAIVVMFFPPTRTEAVFAIMPGCSTSEECPMVCIPTTVDCPNAEEIKEKKEYEERKRTLNQYSQFFNEVDFDIEDLTVDTSDSKYKKWLEELIDAKKEYDEEQIVKKQKQEELARLAEEEKIRKEKESQEKILELEQRVKALESQKTPVVIQTSITKPALQKPIVQSTPKIEQPPKQIVKENTPVPIDTLIIKQETQKKLSWFKRLIGWLRGI